MRHVSVVIVALSRKRKRVAIADDGTDERREAMKGRRGYRDRARRSDLAFCSRLS